MSDLTTEVIGFRQWRVTENLELRAAAHNKRTVWGKGTNAAVCHKAEKWDEDRYEYVEVAPCDAAPGTDCGCGIYALHDPSDFWYGKKKRDLFSLALFPEPSDPLLSGVIAAWGELEVHYQGFRAQFARVVALATPEMRRDAVIARAVSVEYGVPLVPVDELPRIAAEFGATVPVGLRPEKPEPKKDPLLAQFYTTNPSWSWGGGSVGKPAVVPLQKRQAESGPKENSLLPHENEIVNRVLNRKKYDARDFLPKRLGGNA